MLQYVFILWSDLKLLTSRAGLPCVARLPLSSPAYPVRHSVRSVQVDHVGFQVRRVDADEDDLDPAAQVKDRVVFRVGGGGS